MHEASMHEENCFLTLTYRDAVTDEERLSRVSLFYPHFSGFMKRLRATFPRRRFSFLCAGEYGETNPVTGLVDGGKYRAHFHALLFGFNFPDLVPCRSLGESDLFKSVLLDTLWRHGECRVGAVTFESAAYVARYAMKKITGDAAKAVYTVVLPDGEIIERVPEFLRCSLRPAIGKSWFERFGRHAYAFDSVVMRGAEMQPPRYYDKQLPRVVLGMIGDARAAAGELRAGDHTDERNVVRDVVVRAGLNKSRS